MTFDELVRLGAQRRMSEIQAEIAGLEDLVKGAETPQVVASTMSEQQRAAVSVRMKAYWASRRAAKA